MYNKQNFEDGQVLKAEHLNKMEDGIAKANSIIVSERTGTLTWDGDMTGRAYVDIGDGSLFVHVSDATPNIDDFANGGSFKMVIPGGAVDTPFTGGDILDTGVGIIIGLNSYFCVAATDGIEAEGLTFPLKGIYFITVPSAGVNCSELVINGYLGFTKEYIAPTYLPNNQLYADDTYLYKTSDISNASNRLTKSELKDYAMKNASIKVVVQGEAIFGVFFARNVLFLGDDPFGSVSVYAGSNYQTLYTAEYTPET